MGSTDRAAQVHRCSGRSRRQGRLVEALPSAVVSLIIGPRPFCGGGRHGIASGNCFDHAAVGASEQERTGISSPWIPGTSTSEMQWVQQQKSEAPIVAYTVQPCTSHHAHCLTHTAMRPEKPNCGNEVNSSIVVPDEIAFFLRFFFPRD